MNGGNYTSDELKKQKTLTEQRYQTESAYQTISASATTCPHCGAAVPEGCDLCETCHRYIKDDVCPFCGADINKGDKYCQECGSLIGKVEQLRVVAECDKGRRRHGCLSHIVYFQALALVRGRLYAVDRVGKHFVYHAGGNSGQRLIVNVVYLLEQLVHALSGLG